MTPLQSQNSLYSPQHEHDSCGVGCVLHIKNQPSHSIVEDGLTILANLRHRGGVGADPDSSDGAGILIQVPHQFFAETIPKLTLHKSYGVAQIHLPSHDASKKLALQTLKSVADKQRTPFIAARDLPVNSNALGKSALKNEPAHVQAFLDVSHLAHDPNLVERSLFITRRLMEIAVAKLNNPTVNNSFHIASLSSRTIVYKGMLRADRIAPYFTDLQNPLLTSALALAHQRFSTNTFPSWRLAHPYRYIAHNGEINTIRGNLNWMNARRKTLSSPLLGDDLQLIHPLIPENQSDAASLDNALEILLHGGYSLAHALMTLIPEAWNNNHLLKPQIRDFYAHHAALMEPWDGPAAVVATNGVQLAATLDRNGLRPSRYLVTHDDRLILGSETGVLPVAPDNVLTKQRLQPGKTLLVDLEEGRIVGDDELKSSLAAQHPYAALVQSSRRSVHDLPTPNEPPPTPPNKNQTLRLLKHHGYTREDFKFILNPMASSGAEPIGSMGVDVPLAVLSEHPRNLYSYFKQDFAQVTNPPVDPIREEIVMSLASFLGPRPNPLDLSGNNNPTHILLEHPVLSHNDFARVRSLVNAPIHNLHAAVIDATFPLPSAKQPRPLLAQLDKIQQEAKNAVENGADILIVSDRNASSKLVGVPSLLAVSAVHHHLVKHGLRTSVGIVVETADAREIHHFCCLAGFGADAVYPYLAFQLVAQHHPDNPQKALDNYVKALKKGLLKVMSKMGVSTYHSYCGAQIFDAVGLERSFINSFFPGVHSTVDGADALDVERETLMRHARAFNLTPDPEPHDLQYGGQYAFRVNSERHVWTPDAVRDLQRAARLNQAESYEAFAKRADGSNTNAMSLRSLFQIKSADDDNRSPVNINNVEPVENILKRFSTGAMSFGSISREAHTTLAVAMNRIGGKSNTGEGGEESDRFKPLPNGDSMRSAIKQVASGRFGVTAEYLANSDMIQIKMAQGAKPGEGGQLPGHKVDLTIARVRHSTPGVGLISPPPHHDIYCIEDLAQLIFDLKNVNPKADISVKLVSEVGVGTIAAGVAKACADHVTIAGDSGGTGASPLSSIHHAGSPWEPGLAETHQTLVKSDLRTRISVQVDGGMRTGRDVVIGALLGADEFGFSTAPLIATGCIMMRKCHLNTCPVGVATQNPELRKRFRGAPEHVVNYFHHVAQHVRSIMADMGFTSFNELIGRTDLLNAERAVSSWKAQGLNFERLFAYTQKPQDKQYKRIAQQHPIKSVMDKRLIAQSQDALLNQKPVRIKCNVSNRDRAVGAMLSGEIAKKYGNQGLPNNTINVSLEGSAGQSFGAWLANGVSLSLIGDANDYVGKGLSGGSVSVAPHPLSSFVPQDNIIVGNTCLYGAVAGSCFIQGVAGERFAVRNSGAHAVVEGVGDHGCEYMTGGVVVVIGSVGRNFAAGMSGGIAYVLDPHDKFSLLCNHDMVEVHNVTHVPEHEDVSDQIILNNPLQYDAERVRRLLLAHVRATKSAHAQNLLNEWSKHVPFLRKVTPVDFRRALMDAARRDATDDLTPAHAAAGGV